MNGVLGVYAFERGQSRFIRRMMLLSLLFHVGMILLGSTVSSLFPPRVVPPVVTVELTDAPVSTLPEEEPAPSPPVLRSPAGAPLADAPVPPQKTDRPQPSQRWLEKLDAGLSRVPDAPVARKTGKAGGLPVRHWENEAAPRPGDFAPAVAPEKSMALAKHVDDLEGRVRRSGSPAVGTGTESEASAMFSGVGSSSDAAIPPWIRDMIRKKVRGYLPELEAAYSAALRRNPKLKGKLMVRFRIDPSGKIQRADSMESSFQDDGFIATVLEKIRHWTFDPLGGYTVEVQYPFVFVAPT